MISCPTCHGGAPSCPQCWGEGKVEACGNCGAEKDEWVKKNFSSVYVEYDWFCSKCHTHIRESNH